MTTTLEAAAPNRDIQRVKHETKRRLLTASAIEDITPHMRRVTFTSPDLSDFVSLGVDDHIKLLIEDGAGGHTMRDYTPRRYDNAACTLIVDFALHEATGPATAWALNAKVGDTLLIGGPRGSAIVPTSFDWFLLVGDETALPAMGRWLEELPAGKRALSIGVVDNAGEMQKFDTATDWTGEWVCRDTAGKDDIASVKAAIDRLLPREGDGFVWIAAEAQVARALRAHLMEAHGQNPKWMKAAGYWVKGAEGVHQPID
jgi:NADPH-dependent ferric siderophore reductase